MSRYLYKKIQNISPESLNFQHSGLKLTTLRSDPNVAALQPLFVFILLQESSSMNGQEQPTKVSGQQIRIIYRTTIKALPSGMVLTLSRKRSSLAGIQKLLSGRSSNPDHTKYRPIVCAWVFWTLQRSTAIRLWRSAVSKRLLWISKNIPLLKIRYLL